MGIDDGERPLLSVVLPVFNERSVIASVASSTAHHVRRQGVMFEMLAVDDASTDGTGEILRRVEADIPELRVISQARNGGHGMALRRGFDEARGVFIFHLDSDGQVDAADFDSLWPFAEEYDLVLGVRSSRNDPVSRLALTRVVRVVASLIAGTRLADPNVPFRIFRRDLWERLRPHLGDDALAPSILVAVGAARLGAGIVEVPVRHVARPYGRSSLRSLRLVRFSLRGLWQLLSFSRRLNRQ